MNMTRRKSLAGAFAALAINLSLSGSVRAQGQPAAPEGNVRMRAERYVIRDAGNRPAVQKLPESAVQLRVYDASEGSCAAGLGGLAAGHRVWSEVAAQCTALATGQTDETGGAMFTLDSTKSYLILGTDAQGQLTATEIAVDSFAADADLDGRSDLVEAAVRRIVKSDGEAVPARVSAAGEGKLLLVDPAYVVWDSAQENVPVVVDATGDWGVSITLEAPRGLSSDVPAVALQLNSEPGAVQFQVQAAETSWERLRIQHVVQGGSGLEILPIPIEIGLTPAFARLQGFDQLDEEGILWNPASQ